MNLCKLTPIVPNMMASCYVIKNRKGKIITDMELLQILYDVRYLQSISSMIGNKVLAYMATFPPLNKEEFVNSYGLGENIYKECGEVFIREIKRYLRKPIEVDCVWEHNGNDSLLYASNFIGAYTRGEDKEKAISKMQNEIDLYLRWIGETPAKSYKIEIVQEKESTLQICDADSDVIFDSEKDRLSMREYKHLKNLALKSASTFLWLYESIKSKKRVLKEKRVTFYGKVPQSADEMYEHVNNVNEYYFGSIGVASDNEGDIYDCRKRGFETLEKQEGFLENKVYLDQSGEEWTVRKVMRRFIWHDRIHAKALYRSVKKVSEEGDIKNTFLF